MGKVRALLWGEAPESKAERKLLFKIDVVIMVRSYQDKLTADLLLRLVLFQLSR